MFISFIGPPDIIKLISDFLQVLFINLINFFIYREIYNSTLGNPYLLEGYFSNHSFPVPDHQLKTKYSQDCFSVQY
jgi:hypothetical protein